MTIDEMIAKEKEEAKRLRKIIETGYDGEISIEAIFCDDTDAIKEAYERFENCVKEHKQIAEWLEKLKYIENIILKWNADWYNDEDNGIPDNEILEAIFNACTDNGFDIPIDEDFSKGYNKAIDDFASELENHSIHADIGKLDEVKMEWVSPVTRIKEVAEQLKAGGENE